MKRFIAAAMLLLGGAIVTLRAQSMWDAYNFSQTTYYGTAKSVALGNAMTAVGGDLGSLTLNPAGSAVAPYSTFVLTPAITVTTTNTMGQALQGQNSPYAFQNSETDYRTRFKMPNFGLMLNMDTGKARGLRNWSFGFVGNATHNYQNMIFGSGTNEDTSLAGALATAAGGYSSASLNADWFDTSYNPLPSWQSMAAYKAALIDTYGVSDSDYIGVTERLLPDGSIDVYGLLDQEYSSRRSGNKYDLLTNLAFNISDRFFFGFNMGITSLSFRNEEIWLEAASANPFVLEFGTGDVLHFEKLRMRYSYEADGAGIYAKAGFLWRITNGLRIGAAIQSPTAFGITERYVQDAKTEFTENVYEAKSPQGEWSYDFRSPWSYNVGLAWTIGSFAMLSADYEYTDYSIMKFRAHHDDYYDFSYVNNDIKQYMGAMHSLRAGLEVRPIPALAIRGGYNYSTHPQLEYVNGDRSAFSFGLGYSSAGSFFADLAVRLNYLPEEHLNIYSDYIYDADNNLVMPSPTVNINTTLVDALVTVGWRF